MHLRTLFATTIRTRIAISFGILVLLAAVQGAYGLYYMDVLNQRIEHMYTQELLTVKRLGEIKSMVYAMHARARDHAELRTSSSREMLSARIQEGRAQVRDVLASYKIVPLAPVEQKLIKLFEAHFIKFAQRLQDEILSLKGDSKSLTLSVEELTRPPSL